MNTLLLVRVCIVFLICLAEVVISNSIDEITPCAVGDSKCFLKSTKILFETIVNGNEELDIGKNDPIHQDVIEMNLSSLKYKLKDVETYGYTLCSVESVEASETFLNIGLFCKNFTIIGKYEIDGKILTFPLKGKGDMGVLATNYNLKWNINLKQVNGEDGKIHLSIKSFEFLSELTGDFKLYLENLFNGRKDFNDLFNKALSQNGKAISQQLERPIFDANLKVLAKSLNKCFQYFPMDTFLKK